MNNFEITKMINNRIEELKAAIIQFPRGGGFESLSLHLGKLEHKIHEIHLIIGDINRDEMGANVKGK